MNMKMMKLLANIDKALIAPDWERTGNEWDPDYHFTGSPDVVCSQFRNRVKDTSRVVAYWLYEPMPGFLSLEIQMAR